MRLDKKDMVLYAVTDRHWLNGESLYSQVEKALKGGATFIQLREKNLAEEEFLAEAKESGDLSAAAENYSLSVVPATYGKDDETLNADVYAAAEQLSDGEYSDVIESDNGYYVVYMESTSDADATQPKIDSILSDRTNEAYSAWLDPLKEGAEITVNDKNVEKLTFDRIYTVKAADEATASEAPAED